MFSTRQQPQPMSRTRHLLQYRTPTSSSYANSLYPSMDYYPGLKEHASLTEKGYLTNEKRSYAHPHVNKMAQNNKRRFRGESNLDTRKPYKYVFNQGSTEIREEKNTLGYKIEEMNKKTFGYLGPQPVIGDAIFKRDTKVHNVGDERSVTVHTKYGDGKKENIDLRGNIIAKDGISKEELDKLHDTGDLTTYVKKYEGLDENNKPKFTHKKIRHIRRNDGSFSTIEEEGTKKEWDEIPDNYRTHYKNINESSINQTSFEHMSDDIGRPMEEEKYTNKPLVSMFKDYLPKSENINAEGGTRSDEIRHDIMKNEYTFFGKDSEGKEGTMSLGDYNYVKETTYLDGNRQPRISKSEVVSKDGKKLSTYFKHTKLNANDIVQKESSLTSDDDDLTKPSSSMTSSSTSSSSTSSSSGWKKEKISKQHYETYENYHNSGLNEDQYNEAIKPPSDSEISPNLIENYFPIPDIPSGTGIQDIPDENEVEENLKNVADIFEM